MTRRISDPMRSGNVETLFFVQEFAQEKRRYGHEKVPMQDTSRHATASQSSCYCKPKTSVRIQHCSRSQEVLLQ